MCTCVYIIHTHLGSMYHKGFQAKVGEEEHESQRRRYGQKDRLEGGSCPLESEGGIQELTDSWVLFITGNWRSQYHLLEGRHSP